LHFLYELNSVFKKFWFKTIAHRERNINQKRPEMQSNYIFGHFISLQILIRTKDLWYTQRLSTDWRNICENPYEYLLFNILHIFEMFLIWSFYRSKDFIIIKSNTKIFNISHKNLIKLYIQRIVAIFRVRFDLQVIIIVLHILDQQKFKMNKNFFINLF
jgi:hypothetical protein